MVRLQLGVRQERDLERLKIWEDGVSVRPELMKGCLWGPETLGICDACGRNVECFHTRANVDSGSNFKLIFNELGLDLHLNMMHPPKQQAMHLFKPPAKYS